VSWTAPTGGGAVDHYVVTMQPGGQTITTTGTAWRFGAKAGTAYTVTVAAVSANGVTGPATSITTTTTADQPVVPSVVPDAPLTLTTDKGTITKAAPGEKITVVGSGFLPFSEATVIIYSTPQVLGTVVTDATGSFSVQVQVPAGLAAGRHSLVASGVAPDGTERFLRMNVTVDAAGVATVDGDGDGKDSLAYTGSEPLVPALLGIGALVGGGALLFVSRRRRTVQV
jgi:LPXTG-motif cell wall-anchored protein